MNILAGLIASGNRQRPGKSGHVVDQSGTAGYKIAPTTPSSKLPPLLPLKTNCADKQLALGAKDDDAFGYCDLEIAGCLRAWQATKENCRPDPLGGVDIPGGSAKVALLYR